jgi:hypothetical protein
VRQWSLIPYTAKRRPGRHIQYSDSLHAERSSDQIPVVEKLSLPVQTSPGAHLASYTMGPFPRVKWPGCGVDHPTAPSVEVKERVELHLYSASGPVPA